MKSRLRKRQVGDAVRNQVNLLRRDPKYILQKLGRVLAHNNKTIRACGDFLQDDQLVDIWLTKNRMQSCHHWHFEVLQQPQDMAAALPSKNPVLMLQTHEIDFAGIKKVGGCLIGGEIALGYLESYPRRVAVADWGSLTATTNTPAAPNSSAIASHKSVVKVAIPHCRGRWFPTTAIRIGRRPMVSQG